MSINDESFHLRLPSSLKRVMEREAKKKGLKSLNSYIVMILLEIHDPEEDSQ